MRAILVCGSRTWTDERAIETALLDVGEEWGCRILDDASGWHSIRVLHGGAAGADAIAGRIAEGYGFMAEAWPADWNLHGRRAGIFRNLAMLDAKPDLVLAFWDGKSKGTAHTIREAEKRGIEVRIVEARP